jgi:hypothetical protein
MNDSNSPARGLWSLCWHSVVLLPVALALFAMVCYSTIGLVALPVAAGIFICNSNWWLATASVALWFPSFYCIRWFWRWEGSDDFNHAGDV